MHSQQAAGAHYSTCPGGKIAAHRPRPLHRSAPSIRFAQHTRRESAVGRRTILLTAQAKQVKGEQEASASAQDSIKAEPQEGQADNVATPIQEQLPNQQEVTMKMSQEDLASLKDAIRKQKGGGGTDDSTFVEGILEEVKLITWPDPLQALKDTVVVISIVLGSAVTLFFVNTILADISKFLY